MVDFIYIDCESGSFIWDARKEAINIIRHGIGFTRAAYAFADPQRLILENRAHSGLEPRYFCVGRANGKILTVRFTYRENHIRIIGAGYWRKWRKLYEEKNSAR